MPRAVLFAFVALALPSSAVAQMFGDSTQRFELGQRLRMFERALEKQSDLAARKRVLGTVEKATPAFFSMRLGEASRLLDTARLGLSGEKVPDEVVWSESLFIKPGTRLIDSSAAELPLSVEAFYPVEAKKPDKVSVRFTLGRLSTTVDVKELPLKVSLALKGITEGDHELKCEVLVDGKVRATGEQTVSVVERLSDRLAALQKVIESEKEKPDCPEKSTRKTLTKILSDLAAKKTLETNYPAARLLKEAEALKPGYYGPDRAGQFWLTLGSDPVRVQIPAKLDKDNPVPLVIAMHGAGGSENMFFDGYGDGKVAKLCAERGWLLATTRAGLFPLAGGVDAIRVVDALAKVYPVNTKKVFLVGHSMGAGLAVSTTGRNPERIAAVAALGGGGGLKIGDKVKEVPFYVGYGDRDIALDGAKRLRDLLERAGVKKVVFREYEAVEHLIIVQLALKDVFAFYDEVAKR